MSSSCQHSLVSPSNISKDHLSHPVPPHDPVQALTHQQVVYAKETDQRLAAMEVARAEAEARADTMATMLDATLSRLAALEEGAAAAAAATAATMAEVKDKAAAAAVQKELAEGERSRTGAAVGGTRVRCTRVIRAVVALNQISKLMDLNASFVLLVMICIPPPLVHTHALHTYAPSRSHCCLWFRQPSVTPPSPLCHRSSGPTRSPVDSSVGA